MGAWVFAAVVLLTLAVALRLVVGLGSRALSVALAVAMVAVSVPIAGWLSFQYDRRELVRELDDALEAFARGYPNDGSTFELPLIRAVAVGTNKLVLDRHEVPRQWWHLWLHGTINYRCVVIDPPIGPQEAPCEAPVETGSPSPGSSSLIHDL